MTAGKELVLYYQSPGENEQKKAEQAAKARLLKSVLIRMGVRIRNISPEQIECRVGYLAGLPGFEEDTEEEGSGQELPEISQEVLVLHNFSSGRLDELLRQMRRAKLPPIPLKAVLTEHNCRWRFYELYQELQKEHRAMAARGGNVFRNSAPPERADGDSDARKSAAVSWDPGAGSQKRADTEK